MCKESPCGIELKSALLAWGTFGITGYSSPGASLCDDRLRGVPRVASFAACASKLLVRDDPITCDSTWQGMITWTVLLR